MKPNDDLDFEALRKQRAVRMKLAGSSHYYFFHLYMGLYVQYPTAPFQRELYAITEDEDVKHSVIVAFRGSGKSTIVTLSYPMWAILGKQQKKFVVILSQTQPQARMHLTNIKREFENNELLRKDFGPLEEESDEWGSTALVLPQLGARIIAASAEQSIRGIRFGAHRPDLIIADDVEDMSSVKTREGRNKTYDWFTGEVLPLGDQNTKIVTIGNLLHEDSLLMRLRESFANETMSGTFKKYPLMDADGVSLWPGKFPDHASIEELEKFVGSRVAWQREYLLNIIPDEDQIIDINWIKYYDGLPDEGSCLMTGVGVDLAISQRETADNTAMVIAKAYSYQDISDFSSKDEYEAYILPEMINTKLTFRATISNLQVLYHKYDYPSIYVEDVAYQGAAVEQLNAEDVPAEGIKIGNVDKRARLNMVSHLIENGTIKFPRHGCEELISQLVHFGVEKHDDLVDAFTLLMWQINQHGTHQPRITWL
jgi:predicted phage terminase large subunit-like protein